MVHLTGRLAANVGHSRASAATKQLLHDTFLGPSKQGAQRSRTSESSRKQRTLLADRREIISRKLCDDVVAYLAPSLEPYKGGTLFDINPGACIWSQSLHDFLKPKRHILLEPDEKYFKPFIKPLLQQHDSAYTHLSLAGAKEIGYWDNWTAILQHADIDPHLPPGDPRLKQVDKSMLITGNLWRYTRGGRKLSVKMASMVINQMAWAAQSNMLAHAAGRMRMLWWLPEEEIKSLLAHDGMDRSAISTYIETPSEVRHVVGCHPLLELATSKSTAASRGKTIDEAAAFAVRKRMAEQGLYAPQDRELLTPFQEPQLWSSVDPLKTSCSTIEELEELLRLHEQRREEVLALWQRVRVPSGDKVPSHDEWRRIGEANVKYPQSVDAIFSLSSKTYDRKHGLVLQTALAVDLLLEVVNLEAEWHHLHKTLPDEHIRLELLKSKILEAKPKCYKFNNPPFRIKDRTNIEVHANHLKLQFARPQPINYDTRPFEPLKAEETEFWPPSAMALLDVMPRDIDMEVEGVASASDAVVTCRELIKHVSLTKFRPLAQHLDHIAANGRVDLMPAMPELADPQSGGSIDPDSVLFMNMHRDTILKLTNAFVEWPFKPELSHMAISADDAESVAAFAAEAEEREAQLEHETAAAGA